jgi:hypothetical protein
VVAKRTLPLWALLAACHHNGVMIHITADAQVTAQIQTLLIAVTEAGQRQQRSFDRNRAGHMLFQNGEESLYYAPAVAVPLTIEAQAMDAQGTQLASDGAEANPPYQDAFLRLENGKIADLAITEDLSHPNDDLERDASTTDATSDANPDLSTSDEMCFYDGGQSCTCNIHDNGFGDTWKDCDDLWSSAAAIKACDLYNQSHLAMGSGCSTSSVCGLRTYNPGLGSESFLVWKSDGRVYDDSYCSNWSQHFWK